MQALLKICFSLFFIANIFFHNNAISANLPAFEKFEIVELNFDNSKEKNKPSPYINKNKKETKYALIISGGNYNKTAKNVVVVPVILKKEKDYQGRFVYSIKNSGKTYIVFADKMRTISKNIAFTSAITLSPKEKDDINKTLENILN